MRAEGDRLRVPLSHRLVQRFVQPPSPVLLISNLLQKGSRKRRQQQESSKTVAGRGGGGGSSVGTNGRTQRMAGGATLDEAVDDLHGLG